jgi:hypothetical protein
MLLARLSTLQNTLKSCLAQLDVYLWRLQTSLLATRVRLWVGSVVGYVLLSPQQPAALFLRLTCSEQCIIYQRHSLDDVVPIQTGPKAKDLGRHPRPHSATTFADRAILGRVARTEYPLH